MTEEISSGENAPRNEGRGILGISLQERPTEEVVALPRPYRDITIRFVANGYIAKVGCQEFVFGDYDDLIRALRLYDIDPIAAEKTYVQKRR